MSQPFKIACLTVLFGAAVQSQVFAEEFDKGTVVEEAKVITKAFAGSLQKELKAAIHNGGPVNGLSVCNQQAMPITKQITSESDAQVSRVSLKNRNPANVPNDWQTPVLEDFDLRAANGESVETMASATVTELDDGKRQLRFMKARPTGGVCLACHGQEIDDSVQAKLDELYPDDKAIGYSPGEVRGAIVVIKDYEK